MYIKETAPGKQYRVYTEVDEFIADLPAIVKTWREKKKKYLYIGAGYDIETTLIGRKSFTYHQQWCFGDMIVLYRKWTDFEKVYDALSKLARRSAGTLIVWVANLGYEFSYICRRIKINSLFAREERHPLKFRSGNLEFRDCLAVSGQGGLANLAKNYCVTKKLVGGLDYSKIRNTYTPVTAQETDYYINDVAILAEWHEYCMQRWVHDGRGSIPMTLTGICRSEVKKYAGRQLEHIQSLIKMCYPADHETYSYMMTWLFRGGYTHANILHVGRTVENVIGVDFTSSYPAVMLHQQYPMTPFIPCELETDGVHITDDKVQIGAFGDYCVWMVVEMWGVTSRTWHSIESKHKIIEAWNDSYDNGRLSRAGYIRVALTELDYDLYEKFYRWERINVCAAWFAEKGPLPDYLLRPLMDAYQTKTRLKRMGMDKTVEYVNAKIMVNSFYGMTVTRLSFTDWTFDADAEKPWIEVTKEKPYSAMIADQILLPQWGIWITAHARHNLLSVVAEMDAGQQANVLYCDTDSIYFIDTPACRKIIEQWNAVIMAQNKVFPDEFDDIGAFDYIDHGIHYRFKTLGAKRYIKLDDNGHTTVTVAGMRRGTFERMASSDTPPDGPWVYVDIKDDETGETTRRYLSTDTFFDKFDDMLLLSAEQSCKIACLYHDEEYSGIVDGEYMQELSGAALVNIPFQMRLDRIWYKDALRIQRRLRRDDI